MNTIWLDLLGCTVNYRGNRYRTRTIERGEGNAQVLICIHGNGGHAEAYSRNLKALGEHVHVISIDLVWHGLSSKPEFTEAMRVTYADQIIDLLDSMGIEKAAIEGELLGGWVALWMALHHSDRVTKVVANTTAGVFLAPAEGHVPPDPAEFKRLRDLRLSLLEAPSRERMRPAMEWLMRSPDRVTEELIDLRTAIYSDPETSKALMQVALHSFGSKTDEALREEHLARIAVPVLVVWTDHNPIHDADYGKRIADLIPGSRFFLIEDAGHWPQWEQAEAHDRRVIQFLTGD